MFQAIQDRCGALAKNFREIPTERKELLQIIADYIINKRNANEAINLVYVCTHNSRRSHLGQVWAAVAAAYYGIANVSTFSGGTEATAFNPNAIQALTAAGFDVRKTNESNNPVYEVYFSEKEFTTCFSKVYNHEVNPEQNFAAIMTCSDAEDNCPFIPGCDLRIGTTYNDPKAFDTTILQNEKYTERSNQIAMECLYVFSKVVE
ncbi:low molecular weight phosphatase family protein [Lacibacter sediminis]|uniref:Protein-tyrosine-phosphatase n=1 Tax=Lacibacter sediminis TaxID=2760713 RepID=A0A7G5XE62_9BACT|nr:protein-tyrosine-phosphatase [Lacibacter sediminis]QNA43765.1 protein-tyrosine-phosphatase [Lacibacter sediminis]